MNVSLFVYKNDRICGVYFKVTGKAAQWLSKLQQEEQLSCQGCGDRIEKGYGKVYFFSEFLKGEGKVLIHVMCSACTTPVTNAIREVISGKQARPNEEKAAAPGGGVNA